MFKRNFLYLLIAFLGLFVIARLYYNLTDDFRLANIRHPTPEGHEWQTASLSPEERSSLFTILGQPFHYIGKGAQCYAFVSEDQQYVLKFFKFKHLRPALWVEYLPAMSPFQSYKENVIEKKKCKLIGVFDGYHLAYQKNKEGSELLYLHLMPTQDLNHTVTVIDKLGLSRQVNLDDVVFLVQKKGETLRTRLNRELKQNQVDQAKYSIASILRMYISEYQKGLYDRDHGVMHNTGFIQDQPFHLDVGKFSYDKKMTEVVSYKKDLEHVVWKIDEWIKNNYPSLYDEFNSFLSDQYYQYTNEFLDIKSIDPKRFKKKKSFIYS